VDDLGQALGGLKLRDVANSWQDDQLRVLNLRVHAKEGRPHVLELIKGANLALRFLLELCALGALGYWGFKTGSVTIAKIGLGIGAPLVAAIVWGTFVAPRAPVQLPLPLTLLLQVLVFGSAATGLASTGHRTLAWVLAMVVAANAILMYVWGQ
jgi:Protein of unknown function (DUF2568)